MAENIFLFVPNLIGYARIVLAIISFYYMRTEYMIAVWCYIISVLLDDLDGYAARKLDQVTQFGAMLDQLTDRIGTTCLLVCLSVFYPDYMIWFQLSMGLDIGSHWLHLHVTNLQGKTNHKLIEVTENALLRIYYTSRPFFLFLCAGNELFYAMLYLVHFTGGPEILGIELFKIFIFISAPVAAIKTLISLIQLVVAAKNMGIIDVSERQEAREKTE